MPKKKESKTSTFSEIKPLVFSRMSKAKMKEIGKRVSESLRHIEGAERLEEAEKWKPKTQQIGECLCGGVIVVLTIYTSEYNPKTGSIIIGPASREQFRRVERSSCFCEECGIVYNPGVVQKKKRLAGKNK